MTEDKRYVLGSAEIGESVPGEHTFGCNDDIVPVWFDDFQEAPWFCGHVAVDKDFAMVIQDADVDGSGMKVDAAVEFIFLSIESH